MKRRSFVRKAAIGAAGLVTYTRTMADERSLKLTIVAGGNNASVERYSAEELARYIFKLWKFRPVILSDHDEIPAGPSILLGSPSTNVHIARLAGNLKWDQIRDDGFFIKTVVTEPDILVIGGRLPRGTLFGVYDLVERWGMRFSLTEDIYPSSPGLLSLGPFDEKIEPSYATRAMRPSNNLPEGSAPWDLPDFMRFIDQMAKLKYNTYNFVIQESGPWLDYNFRGIQRPAGDIFYGWRYKIDTNFIGKELFPGRQEFYNPVLAQAKNDEQRKQLGIGLVRSIIGHCKDRGLMSLLTFSFLEPPTAFKYKMNDWATLPLPDPDLFPKAPCFETPAEEFGTNPKYSAWMNVLDPAVKELTAVRLKALIDTYPDADFYHLWVSEHRAGVVDYRKVFRMLDDRYNLSPEFNLDKELNNMGTYPYGMERYQNQLKGDLLFLYLFDEIFVQDRLLERTLKPDARIALAGVMPELWPLVARILPKGMYFDDWLEYGTHATADRISDIVPVLEAKVPTTLEIGIQDDNTMWFPQVNVESLERIIHTTAPLDMQGYVVPIWQIRQVDINSAYLARASWQPGLTADRFYKDYLVRMVGSAAAPYFEQAQRILEKADHEIKKALYGFAFPWPETIPGMLGGVDQDTIARIRPMFESALSILFRARKKATKEGLPRVEFWLKRTQFGIGWLDLGAETAALGKLLGPDIKTQTPLKRELKQKSLESLDHLLIHTRELIELIMSDAGHIGDLGQIASLNRYVYEYFGNLRLEFAQRSIKD
jgi:hypothetical protein